MVVDLGESLLQHLQILLEFLGQFHCLSSSFRLHRHRKCDYTIFVNICFKVSVRFEVHIGVWHIFPSTTPRLSFHGVIHADGCIGSSCYTTFTTSPRAAVMRGFFDDLLGSRQEDWSILEELLHYTTTAGCSNTSATRLSCHKDIFCCLARRWCCERPCSTAIKSSVEGFSSARLR